MMMSLRDKPVNHKLYSDLYLQFSQYKTTVSSLNSTSNTTAQWTTTTTTTPASTTAGFFSSSDGRLVLALLIIILLFLMLVPLIVYLLVRRVCVLKQEVRDRPTDEQENNKETQTDVMGLELQEFYQRRKPFDMSKHMGKKLTEVEEPPRWHNFNPEDWNDPWTSKYAGKETNYIEKAW